MTAEILVAIAITATIAAYQTLDRSLDTPRNAAYRAGVDEKVAKWELKRYEKLTRRVAAMRCVSPELPRTMTYGHAGLPEFTVTVEDLWGDE